MTTREWKEVIARRAQRRGDYGRAFELDVERVLTESKRFDHVVRHAPNSEADTLGHDFTVCIGERSISFGAPLRAPDPHADRHPSRHHRPNRSAPLRSARTLTTTRAIMEIIVHRPPQKGPTS